MILRSVKEVYGDHIQATDGEIGKVHEFLFDDEHWAIRYLMVDTGGWLSGRHVLISAAALDTVDWQARALAVKLTREQVEQSPDITTDQPVSRQHELVLANYYGYAPYWGGTGLWAGGGYPMGLWGAGTMGAGTFGMGTQPTAPGTSSSIVTEALQREATQAEHGDQHLRSTREVTGYTIQALDDDIGHVDDFIMDDETWAIHYIVVDTHNWWPGKHVLVSPRWISAVSWEDHTIHVDLRKEQVKSSPEYDPARKLNHADVEQLHQHYDRPADGDTNARR